ISSPGASARVAWWDDARGRQELGASYPALRNGRDWGEGIASGVAWMTRALPLLRNGPLPPPLRSAVEGTRRTPVRRTRRRRASQAWRRPSVLPSKMDQLMDPPGSGSIRRAALNVSHEVAWDRLVPASTEDSV